VLIIYTRLSFIKLYKLFIGEPVTTLVLSETVVITDLAASRKSQHQRYQALPAAQYANTTLYQVI
jgi:hypothetical protein